MARMQWCRRPGPSRPCAISKPRPSPSSMLPTGTRTLLYHGEGGCYISQMDEAQLAQYCSIATVRPHKEHQ